MLDGFLIKAIQALSRATKDRAVASLLLKIIHQQLVVEKSILILERQGSKPDLKADFLTAVADCSNPNLIENKNSVKPKITFYSSLKKEIAPYSLLKHCRHQPQPKFVFEKVHNLSDSYLKQQQPHNFSYFPVADRQQFYGILYLENIGDRQITPQTKKAIAVLTTQAAIALNGIKRDRVLVYAKSLEKQQQDRKALEKILPKIRSCIDSEAVIETTVTEIETAFKVTRCQVHSYLHPSQSDRAMGVSQDNRPIAIDNVNESPLIKYVDPIFKHWQIKSLLAVKTSYGGKVNGLIMLHQCDRYRQWTTAEITMIETIAAQVGVAIAYTSFLEREKQQRLLLERQNYLLQQEISEYQKAQTILQHREQIYQNIFDGVSMGIVEKQYDSNSIVRANARFCAITGYSKSELFNKSLLEITHPEDVDQTITLIRQLQTGQIDRFSMEKRYLCKNGSYIWAKTTVCPLKKEAGITSCIAVIEDITSIEQDRKKLKQQAAVMEAAIDGMAILEGEHFIYLNLSHATIFGYDNPVELLGRNWRSLYEPEQAQKLQQEAFLILTRQGYWRGELQAKKKDGTPFDQEIALIELNETQMVCICRDISDRKQQEKQLKASQQRYKALATAAPVGIFRTDPSGNFTYVNDRWCAITQLSPQEAMNRGWLEAVHPQERDLVSQQWQEAIALQASFCSEYRFLTRHRVEIWVFAQAIAEYDGEGKLLGYVGTITNISQLKVSQKVLAKQLRKEQLLRQMIQEIRRNLNTEAIFQTAAIQIGQIYQVSRCLIHKYVNHPEPQIPLVAQYSSQRLLSRKTTEPALTVGQNNMSFVDRPIPVVGNSHLERVLSQDLAVVSFNVESEPLLTEVREICQDFEIKSMLAVRTSDRGVPNGIIILHQCDRYREWSKDEVELIEAVALQMGIAIAQAQLLEKEQQQHQKLYLNNLALTKAKQDAEVANQTKSQFLAHMSHELRTPLNAILGFSQIMASDSALDSSQQEQLLIINRSGQHLLNLINNILDLAKIEAGKTSLQQDYLDFYDFISVIEKMFRLQARTKGLQLNFEIDPNVPQYVITDGLKLKQILINLLDNALKFTKEGEVSLQVKCQQRSLIFKIIDSGAGIAKAELDRIFEPFEQTDTGIKSARGTGLGLSICRSLIKLLGGMLEVESLVGRGTTFLFHIPIQLTDCDTVKKSNFTQPINELKDVAIATSIDLEELNKMPIPWLEKLHHAAIAASDRQIQQLIAAIAESHPILAANLEKMVDNFALEGIINQTESLLDI